MSAITEDFDKLVTLTVGLHSELVRMKNALVASEKRIEELKTLLEHRACHDSCYCSSADKCTVDARSCSVRRALKGDPAND